MSLPPLPDKCGRENCMGWRTKAVTQWVTKEALDAAVAAERERAAITVWMTMQESTEDGADDLGTVGWMRLAEDRIRQGDA